MVLASVGVIAQIPINRFGHFQPNSYRSQIFAADANLGNRIFCKNPRLLIEVIFYVIFFQSNTESIHIFPKYPSCPKTLAVSAVKGSAGTS